MFEFKKENYDMKIINNIRSLAIDAINEAKSGHPGIALGAAPILYTLYSNHLNINMNDAKWVNRDRFILSAGHGSALLYTMLYMVGYLNLEDLEHFRQIDSKTPGHPEITTMGVDAATGPLGQGLGMGVGIALGERYLNSYFNNLYNHYTYVLVGDGDLQEGISYEVCSLAGKLKLNKLIVLYDSNDITLDGVLNDSFNEDIKMRFESMAWNYILVTDGENVGAINEAIIKAKASSKPTIIEVKTIIGRYSINQGSSIVHGSPLEEDDILKLKEKLEVLEIPFNVSQEAIDIFRTNLISRTEPIYQNWLTNLVKVDEKTKKLWDEFITRKEMKVKDFGEEFIEEQESTRVSSHKVLNALKTNNLFLIGGSADTRSSTKSFFDNEDYIGFNNYQNKNICYGIREAGMGAITNGLALLGLTPFASTFLAFSDYLKPAIRMSALMNLGVIYIFTHDSISVGEDGPTHQPVEQLVSLRSIPNLDVYRPSDLNEVIGTYQSVLKRKKPAAIICSRNKVKTLSETKINEVAKGGYVLKEENQSLVGTIIATGEEIHLAVKVQEKLATRGFGIRLVSMPSIELFEEMSEEYQQEVLGCENIYVIEASSSYSWYKFTKDLTHHFTVNNFGYSGKKEDVWKKFDFDVELIVEKIENSLNKGD